MRMEKNKAEEEGTLQCYLGWIESVEGTFHIFISFF